MGALGLLAAFLITVAVILLTRGNTNATIQIVAPSPTPVTSAAAGNIDGGTPELTPAPDLRVYVQGAVHSPGVYPLQPGDRLEDALGAAGGATDHADLTAVNLAQRVRDEGYYYIPVAGETPPPIATSSDPSTSPLPSDVLGEGDADNELIDLNDASLDALKTLPGIGEARAQAIVSHREEHGPFSSVEQIMEIRGIGEGTYENIRDLVTAGGP